MNKAELVAAVDAALGDRANRAQSAALVGQIVDSIVRAVAAGEKVSLTGFGVFEQQQRAARRGRNPRTGEQVDIPATSTPVFHPALQFKDIVAGHRGFADNHTLASRTSTTLAATVTTETPSAAGVSIDHAPTPSTDTTPPPAVEVTQTPTTKPGNKKSSDKKAKDKTDKKTKKHKKKKKDKSGKKKNKK